MPSSAFVKIGDIKGNSLDQNHKDWVIIDSMSSPIMRTIPQGAVAQQRVRGGTTLADVVVTRQLDKSSTKLQEACANGTLFKEVEVHFCTQLKNKNEPYLIYKLKDVIVSSYALSAQAGQNAPQPVEQISLNYSAVEWTYVDIDEKTGDVRGQVPAQYDAGANKA